MSTSSRKYVLWTNEPRTQFDPEGKCDCCRGRWWTHRAVDLFKADCMTWGVSNRNDGDDNKLCYGFAIVN